MGQVESVAQAVSNLAIQFGDSDDDGGVMSRPFGVAMLFAGCDESGPQLYHMDPSGTYLQFDAKAIGSGSEARSSLCRKLIIRASLSRRPLKLPLLFSSRSWRKN